MKPYEIIDTGTIPPGALFLSIDSENKVHAHFAETWTIGNDVYSASRGTYLGESFTPVDRATVIELPLTLDDITDETPENWVNYVTVSGSGDVKFWEYNPTKQVNGDDYDDYFYAYYTKKASVGKTKLPYFYQNCYSILELQ